MIELTISTAVEILDELVEEFGSDYVYESTDGRWHYVRDGKPSCIVGHVLAKVGVPIERLEVADTALFGAGMAAATLLCRLAEEEVLTCDVPTGTLLSEAQYNQDARETWADSVKAAKRYARI